MEAKPLMQEQLAGSALHLPPSLQAELLRQGEIRHYAAGDILFHEGDEADHLFLLLSGQLKAYSSGDNDQEVVYSVLKPGELLGELMLDGGPRSTSVKAITEATCKTLDGKTAAALLRNAPDFGEYLVHRLIGRVRRLTRQNRSLVLQDVYERVSSLLEEHTFMNGDVRTVPRILTYQEIANRVGASREMVGNIMRNLIRGGFIVKNNDRQMAIVRRLPKKW